MKRAKNMKSMRLRQVEICNLPYDHALICEKLKCIKPTKRELDCCRWLFLAYPTSQIARILNLSMRTIEHYINNLKIKLHCSSKTALSNYLRNVVQENTSKENDELKREI